MRACLRYSCACNYFSRRRAHHEARRHPPHHRDHRRRAAQRRLLHARARPAPGREDRQPGRPERLPPLLRRRARPRGLGHHVLRVPRRAAPAAPAPGMVHTIVWRVGGPEAIDFWEQRLGAEGVATERDGDVLRFADPEGLGHELAVDATGDEPLSAEHPEIPAEHALQGFDARPRVQLRPGRRPARCSSACSAPSRPATTPGSCAASAAAGATCLDPAPGRARPAGRGHRPPRRVRHDGGRRTRSGSSASGGAGVQLLAGHRPPLLPLDLLPRAGRRPVRDRRRRPRLHGRRAARGARLEGDPAAEARAAARADRGGPHAAARPARRAGRRRR